MDKIDTSHWWHRGLIILFTSVTILSSAASCTWFGLGGSSQGSTILGLLKRDPSIKEEGFGFINQEQYYTGETIPNNLAKASGLKLAQAEGDKLYYLTQENGFFRTTDGGRTWERKYVFGFEGTATEEKEAEREVNSWLNKNDAFISTDFAVDPKNSDIVYVAGQYDRVGRIYKTDSGGNNFQQIYTSVEEKGYARFVTVDPQNSSNVYAAVGEDTIIRSQNGGQTWQKMYVFPRDTVVQIGFFNSSSNSLFAVLKKQGVAFSQDLAKSWQINPLKQGEVTLNEGQNSDSLFSTNNSNQSKEFKRYEKLTPINGGEDWVIIADSQIWFGSSINTTFHKILLPTEAVEYETYDIVPHPNQAPNRMFVTVNDKLFETKDGGVTWSTDDKLKLQSPIGNIGQILIDETNPEIIYLMLVEEKVTRENGLYQDVGSGSGLFS